MALALLSFIGRGMKLSSENFRIRNPLQVIALRPFGVDTTTVTNLQPGKKNNP